MIFFCSLKIAINPCSARQVASRKPNPNDCTAEKALENDIAPLAASACPQAPGRSHCTILAISRQLRASLRASGRRNSSSAAVVQRRRSYSTACRVEPHYANGRHCGGVHIGSGFVSEHLAFFCSTSKQRSCQVTGRGETTVQTTI
jgi:hypothetical protein